jgi:UDP-glucose 4-epimerase
MPLKKILVTGGTGYIGSHTVVELAESGYEPVIVDDFSNSEASVLSGLEKITGRRLPFYGGEFQDKKLLRKIIREEKIDGVIHFAAHKIVGESIEQPLKYYQNNIAGLIVLLQALEELGVNNLVFSSSANVYGEADELPVTEESPIKPPTSPYGATKQIGETMIRDMTRASHVLRTIALRYFNPVGAHPSALIGELQINPPTNLVPLLTQAAAGLRPELVVYGDDYDTPDGTCIRDFIHVVDLAKAHIKALEHLSKQKAGYNDFFNIGTGKGSTILDTIKTFERATGQKVAYRIGARRPGDIIKSYAGVTKAKKTLGWQAEKSLSDALADAWRWQQALKKPKSGKQ